MSNNHMVAEALRLNVEDPDADNPSVARAVLYLRVSTSRQAHKNGEAEGYSIPAQRDACTRKVADLGAEVVREFVDAGASARSADRDGLQALLVYVAEGGVDYVVVHKLDRLARDRADDVAIMLAIRKARATLVSVTENIDDTPAGKLQHGFMASMAEYYSSNLSDEAKKGIAQKAKNGGTHGVAPIGYVNTLARVEGRGERRGLRRRPRRAHPLGLPDLRRWPLEHLQLARRVGGARAQKPHHAEVRGHAAEQQPSPPHADQPVLHWQDSPPRHHLRRRPPTSCGW